MTFVSDKSVSVVIPVYNRIRRLRRALYSVLRQDYRDIEIIVVDDGSAKPVKCILGETYLERCKLITLSENKGAAVARNRGAAVASGRFLAFLDSDDLWLREKVSTQVESLVGGKKTTILSYTGIVHVYSDAYRVQLGVPEKDLGVERLLVENRIGSVSCVMVKRAIFERVGGFDENLLARQDVDLYVRMLRFGDVVRDELPHTIVVHHSGEHRITNRRQLQIAAWRYFYKKHEEEIRCLGVDREYRFKLGRLASDSSGNRALERSMYISALGLDLVGLKSAVALAASFLPRWLRKLLGV